MDQIRESLDRISELSDDELKSLEDSVVTEFGTVESQDPTREVVDTMTQLADAADAIRNEQKRRVSEAAELAQAASEAAARIKGATEDDTNVDDDGDAVDGAPDVEPDADDLPDEADTASAPVVDPADAGEDTPSDVDDDPTDTEDPAAAATTPVTATPDAEAAPADDAADSDTPAPDADDTAAAPVTSTDAPATPDAPADATSDDDAANGGDDDAEEGDLTPDDKKKVATFSSEEPNATELAAEAEPSADDADETPTPDEADTASANTSESSEETVTASASTEGLDFQAPADRAPAIQTISAPVTITAGADIPGITAGGELPNLTAVAQAMIDRRKGMGRTSGGDGEQHTVAVFTTSFPESRMLTQNDLEGNRVKIDAVVSPAAITAAGGSAAPVEVRYELYGLGDTDRPVKDSLAVFGADRGGIRYITPPVLTDLTGAVSLWTLDDDVAAATGPTPVKPSLRVAAGAEVTVYTDAIPLILTFGNMGARAYPELVERHTQLGMIQHARFAETRLLTRIGSLSTTVTATKQLGAARDIFVAVDTAAAAYRNRHRVGVKTPLRAIFPEWFKNALRADLVKQLPGDGMDETFGLAEATINGWFSDRNINVTWTLDGEAGQIFGDQAAGNLDAFPSTVIWYLFSEGTFLFLDGGTLDLGLVRDSTLNGTNDYKIFLETFEGVAKVGIESLRVISPLAIAGASSATVAVAV